jgi:D-methionine transport system substrate-binding protein
MEDYFAMKKLALLLLVSLLALSAVISGCGSKNTPAPSATDKKTIKVGATPLPHAEILNVVKPILEKEGINLVIVEMNDYVRPNMAVAEKELDANFFQHIPYLTKFSAERKLDLTYTAAVHIEPMGIYSKKVKNLGELPSGAKIGIPNDPTNGGRALALLEKAGIIKLKEGVGVTATVNDIPTTPKTPKFVSLKLPNCPAHLMILL